MTTPPPYCFCPLREGATGHKRDGAHAPRPNTTTPRGVILALNSPPCYDEDSIFPLLAQFSSQQSLHRFQQCTPSHWSMRRERKKIGTKKKSHHTTRLLTTGVGSRKKPGPSLPTSVLGRNINSLSNNTIFDGCTIAHVTFS